MCSATLLIGTENALDIHTSSDECVVAAAPPVRTTGDLLARMQETPPRSFAMLRSACGLLGHYLELPGDQILIDALDDRRKGFRSFLVSRKYSPNSVRTYVHQLRVLLATARRFGWEPDAAAPEAWKPLLTLATEKKLTDITRHFSRTTNTPAEVTIEAVDSWGVARTEDGVLFTTVAAKKNKFWRLLQQTGWTTINPPTLIKQNKYGIPLEQLPSGLLRDAEAVLKWKQADYAKGRPKWGKIRAVSANNLRLTICQLAGFAINTYGLQPNSLTELVQKDVLEGFIEWSVNERGKKGHTLQSRLGMLDAVMSHHPMFASLDYTWLKVLIDSIELEDDSERQQRKDAKSLGYDEIEAIPEKIRATREVLEKKRKTKQAAVRAMEELMFRWLLILPWRQRNLRECRVGGPSPNLFKGKIPPNSRLDKPAWVVEEEARNSDAQFWQVKFTPKETKTSIPVHVLLPRQLVEPLEQYLADYRPHLLEGRSTQTLFLNRAGKPMRADQVEKIIGHWTLQVAGVRTTPHLFRDAVAFKWLKEHPKDYLTLSKMLWHRNIQTTVNIYGAQYNESSATTAMEAWLDQRPAYRNNSHNNR
jgi:integrase